MALGAWSGCLRLCVPLVAVLATAAPGRRRGPQARLGAVGGVARPRPEPGRRGPGRRPRAGSGHAPDVGALAATLPERADRGRAARRADERPSTGEAREEGEAEARAEAADDLARSRGDESAGAESRLTADDPPRRAAPARQPAVEAAGVGSGGAAALGLLALVVSLSALGTVLVWNRSQAALR